MRLPLPQPLARLSDALIGFRSRWRRMTGYPASRRHRALGAQPRAPWRPRPIRTSLLYFVFASILLGGWWYYSLQANQIDAARIPGDPQAELEITKMRLDTIRNTLTVAAGLGGRGVPLNSAAHHRAAHPGGAQLGSENATVRIGGLHNLERGQTSVRA